MPTIIIERPYEWNNQKKKIEVYIDNTKVEYVGIDETQHFEVAASQHILMLKNQWPARNTTIDVDVSDNQNKTIKMSTSKLTFWITFGSILLLSVMAPLIRYFFNTESLWCVHIPAIAIMLIIVMFVISKIKPLKLEVLN